MTVTFAPAACGTVQSRAAVGAGGFGALTAGHLEIRFSVASLAAGASCQVDVNVTPSTAGVKSNTTAAPVATGPVALTGTAANGSLTVLSQLTVGKAFAPASIGTNDASVLTHHAHQPEHHGGHRRGLHRYLSRRPGEHRSGGRRDYLRGATVTAANNGTSVALSGATVPRERLVHGR